MSADEGCLEEEDTDDAPVEEADTRSALPQANRATSSFPPDTEEVNMEAQSLFSVVPHPSGRKEVPFGLRFDWMTIEEAAHATGRRIDQVRGWYKNGHVQTCKHDGRRYVAGSDCLRHVGRAANFKYSPKGKSSHAIEEGNIEADSVGEYPQAEERRLSAETSGRDRAQHEEAVGEEEVSERPNARRKIPVGRIVRFLSSLIRRSKDGFTVEERRAIAADLLDLSAHILAELND